MFFRSLNISLSSFFIPALISSIFIYTPSVQAHTTQLPDLGSADLVVYDQQTEARLGRAFTASLHADFELNQDPIINHYIRQLGHSIASYTKSDRNFSFYVIEDSSINAFAGPNGVIGVHTGLIKATENEDELAAVIAHEISHVTQNHLSRRYEYASSSGNINSIATVLAALLIGIYDPNAGMATLMGGMGYNLQQQLKNSRVHETEADTIGIELLYQAGFDPHAMGGFFKRLSQANNNNSFQLPEILRTHPVTDNRLAEAENRAAQYTRQYSLRDPYDFQLIKMMVSENLTESENELTASQRCFKNSMTSKKIPTCLQNIALESDTSNIYLAQYLHLQNQHIIKSKQLTPKDTLEKMKKIVLYKLDLFPNDQAVLTNYAKFLQLNNKINEAIEILKNKVAQQEYKYVPFKQLSELYAKQDKQAYAYLYLAKANIQIGNIARAKHYLEQSQKLAEKNDKILKAEIAFFQQENYKLLKNKDKQE